MAEFFFDTGDLEYIKNVWSHIKDSFSPDDVVGITTNPNAMAKVDVHTKAAFERLVPKLCELVTEIRQGSGGVVYVQHPKSNVTADEEMKWADWALRLSDGVTTVGLKIPPFQEILKLTPALNVMGARVNVTGVADCGTALFASTYSPEFVSIITGRMEEKGIDAKSHVHFVNRSGYKGDLIAGSMRTLEGLAWTIEYGMVPTIGSRLFDQIVIGKSADKFRDMWNYGSSTEPPLFCPDVTDANRQLSVDFFKQMDDAGGQLTKDLG